MPSVRIQITDKTKGPFNLFTALTSTVTGLTKGGTMGAGSSPNCRELTAIADPGNTGIIYLGDGSLAPSASPPVYGTALDNGVAKTWQSTISNISLKNKFFNADTNNDFLEVEIDP